VPLSSAPVVFARVQKATDVGPIDNRRRADSKQRLPMEMLTAERFDGWCGADESCHQRMVIHHAIKEWSSMRPFPLRKLR
jgi:hypothetical protein